MSSNNNRVQTIAMRGVVLTVLLIVGAFTVSIARGESFGDSLPVLLAFVTPTLAMLLAAAKLGSDVDKIKAQTNGNFALERQRVRELADANTELRSRLAAATGDPDSGAIPLPTAEQLGRHRVQPPPGDGSLGGVARFSAEMVAGLHTEGGHVAHASKSRTVTGLVLPWEETGYTDLGALEFGRNTIRIPRDLARCKLHLDHTGTKDHAVVGYATAAEYKPDGLYMSFKVADTPDGDRAILQITEKVRDALSGEVAAIRKNGNTVIDSILTGVALVDTPAFRSARVQSVNASFHNPTSNNRQNGNTMNVKDFILALIAKGASEADARAAAIKVYGTEAVNAISADDLDFTDATEQDSADTEQPEGERAAASFHRSRELIVPGRERQGSGGGEKVHLSIHQAAETIRLVQSGKGADIAHAALADITASTMVDAATPQWLGELWSGPAKTRKLIPLLNRRDLRSRRIQAFTWTQKPLVASYAGDKAEIPTNPVAIAPYEAAAVRWAGGHDLDRAFFDFGETEILEAYWRAMNESYAIVTDTATGTWVNANAKTITNAAATDLLRAMIVARTAIDQATGVTPAYYLANPNDQFALLDYTAQTTPAFLGLAAPDPASIVWTSAVPAGSLVAGAKQAATFYELPGSPLRVEAEHLSHGGRDRALFGYTAHTLDNPDGLVKVQFAAPAGG